ncbi:metallophosphoesterase [Veillonella sp.]|uniref:metallophosphoesterase n=1 Tax=Veillonella sp. TaxID=1926307 RepID=UPI0025F96C56|nr:metallophosphoesterase [Veillonella sp.]
MIFVTGDLHGEKEQIQEYIKVLSDCTKDDILIVAGDFGIPWYSRALDMHYKDDKLLDLLRNANCNIKCDKILITNLYV